MKVLSPVTQIDHPLFQKHQINVWVKRDDLIHPVISGNKWRKLKFNLMHANQQEYQGVLSFGGAYSNHIHALAYACKNNNLKSLAIIRGEEHYRNNSTLSQAISWGMNCHFVDRKTYKLRNNQNYLNELSQQYPDYFIVPEGGSNQHALAGVSEVIYELDKQLSYDCLMLPVGSAGTLSGLIKADHNRHHLLGVAVLKQDGYLEQEVNQLLASEPNKHDNWKILNNFHGGGYAKFSHDDCLRISEFNQLTGITFEPIYSGKMLLAFLALLEQGYFQKNQTVVLLHTGGLQGINGLIEQNKLSAEMWSI